MNIVALVKQTSSKVYELVILDCEVFESCANIKI